MRAFEIGLNIWFVCSFGYLLHDVNGFSPSGQLFGTRFTTKASSLHLPEPRAHFEALQLQDGDGEDISSSISKWDPVTWTAPRFWNSLSFRSATLLSALTLAFKGGAVSLSSGISASVHLFSFAVWFGTMWYTTFIFGLTAFKTLPRRQFGKLQSKLFPKYFNICALTVLLQLLTLSKLPSLSSTKTYRALSVAMIMTLVNLFILEPKSTKIMFERYELEDQPGGKEKSEYKQLQASFGKFHGMSSLTNLIALCAAIVHGFSVATSLLS